MFMYYSVADGFPFKINSYRSTSDPKEHNDRFEYRVLADILRQRRLLKYYTNKLNNMAKHSRPKMRKKVERIQKHLDKLLFENAEHFI